MWPALDSKCLKILLILAHLFKSHRLGDYDESDTEPDIKASGITGLRSPQSQTPVGEAGTYSISYCAIK